jgi:predicted MFS family arabinose efflux permease
MKEGLHFAATHPVARMMVMMGLIPPLLLIPSFSALMPVFAVDVFLTGPEGLGMLLSAVGVGGVLGGVIAASVSRVDRVGLMQTLALLVFASSLIGFSQCTSIGIAVFFLAAAGAAEMVYANSQVTTLQMSAPEAMRGRVASLMPVFPAFISVGALTSGIGADWLGAPATVVVMALTCIGIAGFAWTRHAELRKLRLSELIGGR